MAIKIFSFVEKPGVVNPTVEKIDNSVLDDVTQLGNVDNVYYFSFDDENGSVTASEESELKIYDMDDEDDATDIKNVFKKLMYPMTKIKEMERNLVDQIGVYGLNKALKDQDQTTLDPISQLETEKDEFLKSLGFSGLSVLN
jgi:hypothetical protein